MKINRHHLGEPWRGILRLTDIKAGVTMVEFRIGGSQVFVLPAFTLVLGSGEALLEGG